MCSRKLSLPGPGPGTGDEASVPALLVYRAERAPNGFSPFISDRGAFVRLVLGDTNAHHRIMGVLLDNASAVGFNTPAEVTSLTIKAGVAKARLPLLKMILLSILAGAFIAMGAVVSNVVAHDVSNIGLARLLAGLVFPVGLIGVVLCSGELFTGNCLMIEALMNRQFGVMPLVRNWVIVFIGNLVGSLIIVFIVSLTCQLGYTGGQLGAYTIKVAISKVALTPVQAFASGILCNILVCVAILLATSAKDITGKILGIFIPICTFVTCGFEHSVANMYYIPAGMFAALNPAYASKAMDVYGITAQQLASLDLLGFLGNLLPVTLGNIIGGAGLGVILYLVHRSKICNPEPEA